MKMGRRALLAGTIILVRGVGAAQGANTTPLVRRLVGAWNLIDAETVDAATGASSLWDELERPYTGMIIYTADGQFSVQIASKRDVVEAKTDFNAMDPAKRIAFLNSYYGYFGTYDVDSGAMLVHHHIVASLDPGETGISYTRHLLLSDGVLTLTTETVPNGQRKTFNRLRWKKA